MQARYQGGGSWQERGAYMGREWDRWAGVAGGIRGMEGETISVGRV